MVLAPHRGQGIARRLKAEMWRWLRDGEPQVTRLQIGNAHPNAVTRIVAAQELCPVMRRTSLSCTWTRWWPRSGPAGCPVMRRTSLSAQSQTGCSGKRATPRIVG